MFLFLLGFALGIGLLLLFCLTQYLLFFISEGVVIEGGSKASVLGRVRGLERFELERVKERIKEEMRRYQEFYDLERKKAWLSQARAVWEKVKSREELTEREREWLLEWIRGEKSHVKEVAEYYKDEIEALEAICAKVLKGIELTEEEWGWLLNKGGPKEGVEGFWEALEKLVRKTELTEGERKRILEGLRRLIDDEKRWALDKRAEMKAWEAIYAKVLWRVGLTGGERKWLLERLNMEIMFTDEEVTSEELTIEGLRVLLEEGVYFSVGRIPVAALEEARRGSVAVVTGEFLGWRDILVASEAEPLPLWKFLGGALVCLVKRQPVRRWLEERAWKATVSRPLRKIGLKGARSP